MKTQLLAIFIVASSYILNGAESDCKLQPMKELAVFQSGTLEEARECLKNLDSELSKNPDNQRAEKLKNVIKEAFIAEFAISQAADEKKKAEEDLNSKMRNIQITSMPSKLTGKVNMDGLNRAKREYNIAKKKVDHASDKVSKAKTKLEIILGRVSVNLEPPDRDTMTPFWIKVANRHGLKIPSNTIVGSNQAGKNQKTKAGILSENETISDNYLSVDRWSPKLLNNLEKISMIGIHLGMTRDQVGKVLQEKIGSAIILNKTGKSNSGASQVKIESSNSDKSLQAALANSELAFESGGRLVALTFDLELITKISGVEAVSTDDFGQQLMQKYDIDKLAANQWLNGQTVVYEAVVPLDSKNVIIDVVETRARGFVARRRFKLMLVDPLSFGAKQSLYGLSFGMNKAQVAEILRSALGVNVKLEAINNRDGGFKNSSVTYEIHQGDMRNRLGYPSFVVFGSDGGLTEICLNADELEKFTPCKFYEVSSFGNYFMSHFSIDEMKTRLSDTEINYHQTMDDLELAFTYWKIGGYTIHLAKKKNSQVDF